MSQPAHPLFPAEGDEPPRRVEKIHVSRDRKGGSPEFHRNMFAAAELQSLSDIWEAFGGGSYELIAYAGGRISARRRYFLDGRSRPLNPADDDGETPPPMLTTDTTAPTQGDGMGMQTLLMLFKMISDQQNASQQALANVMVAAMSRPTPDPAAGIDRMMSVMQQSQAQQFELLAKVLSAGNSGNPTSAMLDLMKHGIELGRASASASNTGGDDETDLDGIIAQAVAAIGQVAEGYRMGAELDAQRAAQAQHLPQQGAESPPPNPVPEQ